VWPQFLPGDGSRRYDFDLPVCAPGGDGLNRKPQALEIHELVLAEPLATVATKSGGEESAGLAKKVAAWTNASNLAVAFSEKSQEMLLLNSFRVIPTNSPPGMQAMVGPCDSGTVR
jgi:hypothetical protein